MYEIYLTTNLVNGKKYLGQHKLSKQYDYYLGSGKILQEAIKKYGRENFSKTTLATCETKEEANELEKQYIKKYNAVNNEEFYNLACGGDGGGFEYFHQYLQEHPEEAQEFQQRRIDAVKKWQNEYKEIVSKLGKQNIKKCHEWQKKHPECNIGNPEVLKQWAAAHPEEAQQYREQGKQALIKWREQHPEETKKNLALGPQANKLKSGKRIRCLNNGKEFLSVREAEAYYNTYKDAIGRCLRGQLKTAGKDPDTGERLRWEYITENN